MWSNLTTDSPVSPFTEVAIIQPNYVVSRKGSPLIKRRSATGSSLNNRWTDTENEANLQNFVGNMTGRTLR